METGFFRRGRQSTRSPDKNCAVICCKPKTTCLPFAKLGFPLDYFVVRFAYIGHSSPNLSFVGISLPNIYLSRHSSFPPANKLAKNRVPKSVFLPKKKRLECLPSGYFAHINRWSQIRVKFVLPPFPSRDIAPFKILSF